LSILEDGFSTPAGTDWITRCGGCHIGGAFDTLSVFHPTDGTFAGNPLVPAVNCTRCHAVAPPAIGPLLPAEEPIVANCMTCHGKECAKRGFDPADDVHIVDNGMKCQACHVRMDDGTSDHQLAKGCVIDTSEPTWTDTMTVAGTDCESCHLTETGDPIHKNTMLNQHAAKIACETCHTGIRPANRALNDRSWENGSNVTHKRPYAWLPWLKWYDGGGSPSGYPANNDLPILKDPDLMKGWSRVFDAKIFPFNNIDVTWWLKNTGCTGQPPYDDVIPNFVVQAATTFFGGTPTQAQMRTYDHDGDTNPDYPCAVVITDTVSFNVSHSVQPKEEAFRCNDCHIDGVSGEFDDGWDSTKWSDLGYLSGDPMALMGTTTIGDVEMSYHGHLGHFTADITDEHDGMLEKW